MIGEGEMKQQLEPNQGKETVLEEGGDTWDSQQKPDELDTGARVNREKKQARKQFREAFGTYAIPYELEVAEGSSIAERGRNGINKGRGGYGMLLLSNRKVMKLRENSPQSLGLMTGGNIRMPSAGGTLRLFRNGNNIEGIETASNAVPRQGKSGGGIVTSEESLEAKGSMGKRGRPDTPLVAFKGEGPSLDSYPTNGDKTGPGGGIRPKLTSKAIRLYRNRNNSEGPKTTGYGMAMHESGTTVTSSQMENTGSRGKQDASEVTFKGKENSSDGYPMNGGKIISKVDVLTNDTSEGRIAGKKSDYSIPILASRVRKNGTNNMQIYTNRANSQVFVQWAGSLKEKASETLKETLPLRKNDSSSFTGRPLVKEEALKVSSRLSMISGKSTNTVNYQLQASLLILAAYVIGPSV